MLDHMPKELIIMIIPQSSLSGTVPRMSRRQQFLDVLNDIAIIFPVFLIIFTWRGFVQALIARIMGDRTAQHDGQLTLNPLAHVDLTGLVVIMVVFFVLGGLLGDMLPRALLLIVLIVLGVRWTHPVTIDDRQFKHHRLGGIMTSLSGSLANFLLAFMGAGLMRLCMSEALPMYAIVSLIKILQTLIDVALFFGVLDLIPVPPFDGGRVLRYVLPYSAQSVLDWLENYSFIIFLILFFVPVISDIFLGSIFIFVMSIKKMMLSVFF